MPMTSSPATPEDLRSKRRIVALLLKHRYQHDNRPDHREWFKALSTFYLQIRLDQNNPEGWNGFQLYMRTFARWPIDAGKIKSLLEFLKREFP